MKSIVKDRILIYIKSRFLSMKKKIREICGKKRDKSRQEVRTL